MRSALLVLLGFFTGCGNRSVTTRATPQAPPQYVPPPGSVNPYAGTPPVHPPPSDNRLTVSITAFAVLNDAANREVRGVTLEGHRVTCHFVSVSQETSNRIALAVNNPHATISIRGRKFGSDAENGLILVGCELLR